MPEEQSSRVLILTLLLVLLIGGIIIIVSWVAFEGDPTGEKVHLEDCDAISDEKAQIDCLLTNANLSGQASYCLKLPGEFRTYRCLTNLAVLKMNASYCEFIDEKKQFDQGKCFLSAAQAINESALCERIIHSHFQEQCELYFN